MIFLDLNYKTGDVYLAELDPQHYITEDKRVISKLSGFNLANPIVAVHEGKHLELTNEEYDELTADWRRFIEFQRSQGN